MSSLRILPQQQYIDCVRGYIWPWLICFEAKKVQLGIFVGLGVVATWKVGYNLPTLLRSLHNFVSGLISDGELVHVQIPVRIVNSV